MQPGIPIRFVLAAGLVLAAAEAIDASMNNYTVRETNEDGVKLYVLRDAAKDVEVKVAPQFGNIATSMTAHGKAVLWTPYPSAGEWAKHPAMGGVPFLWPWANRIDGWSYWVNGRKYALNPDLGNVRASPKDAPIHGLLLFAKQWKVTRAAATEHSAELESSFEFWREPAMMEQFPFANTVTMIYRLRDGVLEVETRVENLSSEPMPVALGFHPYFQVNDAPRDEWKVRLPAREKFVLNERLIPTGEKRPNPYANPQPLKGTALDDVLGGLVRDADGWARFRLEGAKESVTVEYGEAYPVAVAYAPPGRGFVCFEPMSAPTNAFNAAHDGWFKDLPMVPPGGVWKGVFRVVPEGF
ncbi:MAG: aldose 1-epimerase [Bryobacteraceae bacterium]|jgi:aldose 1-epimerase